MKTIKKITVAELAEYIKNNAEPNKSICFAETCDDTLTENGCKAWHGACVLVDGKEKVLVIRYYGGSGYAFYHTMYGDKVGDEFDADELAYYLNNSSEYVDDYDINTFVYLEIEETE